MGGLFGVVSKDDCVNDLFYGTDYHSHLGTKRGGMAVSNRKGFERSIHSIENSYFRSKFEPDLPKFKGNLGIGVISDNDSQPLIIGSHLGTFAIATVGKLNNIEKLSKIAFKKKMHFSETSGDKTNPTELVAMLICEEDSFENGIESAQKAIKGSCSILLLTNKGLFAARDRLGRTPLVIGKKDCAFAVLRKIAHFLISATQPKDFSAPAKSFFLLPTVVFRRKNREINCRYAHSCGCTMVILPRSMKV